MSIAQPSPSGEPDNPVIRQELGRLAVMPVAQLRIRYRELFRTDPPKAFGPDLLRRSIAHRIQEKAYGGLSRSNQQLLDQMVRAYATKPGGKIVLPRRIKPGSVLVREWNGRSYRVMVQADGFAYDGKTFGNLSEIAGLITGVRWNGPRFFGLRSKAPDNILPIDRDQSKPSAARLKLGGGTDYRKLRNQLGKMASGGNRHGL
jgi:Protein of unknown function (DUF2924)